MQWYCASRYTLSYCYLIKYVALLIKCIIYEIHVCLWTNPFTIIVNAYYNYCVEISNGNRKGMHLISKLFKISSECNFINEFLIQTSVNVCINFIQPKYMNTPIHTRTHIWYQMHLQQFTVNECCSYTQYFPPNCSCTWINNCVYVCVQPHG